MKHIKHKVKRIPGIIKSYKAKISNQLQKSLQKIIQLHNIIHCRKCRASFTIEAAIALSLFIFFTVVLMIPALSLNYHKNLLKCLDENAKAVSKYKYIEKYLIDIDSEDNIILTEDNLSSFAESANIAYLESKINLSDIHNVDLYSESYIDDEFIYYKANYDYLIPFQIFSIDSMQVQAVSYRRAWIGSEGSRWNKDDTEDEDDPTVYVSIKSKNVYHLSPDCSYLKHNMNYVSIAEIKDMRTASGGKYYPCASCKPGNNPSSKVFYTDGGKSYHCDPECKSLKSYVTSMKRSEAIKEGRHLCHRCRDR